MRVGVSCSSREADLTASYNNIEMADVLVARNFQTYPNPASDVLNVSWDNPQFDTPQYLRLLDVSGKVVFEKMDLQDGAVSQEIDLQNITTGMYLLQLGQASGVSNKKIVIKK